MVRISDEPPGSLFDPCKDEPSYGRSDWSRIGLYKYVAFERRLKVVISHDTLLTRFRHVSTDRDWLSVWACL